MTQNYVIIGDAEQIAALDIQHHANRCGWGGVEPLTQRRIRFRGFMREAVIQKRGPFFFAVAYDREGVPHVSGPLGKQLEVALAAIDDSRKADMQH